MKPSVNNSLIYPGIIGFLAGAAAGTSGVGAAFLLCVIACPIRYFKKSEQTQKWRKIGTTALAAGSAALASGITGVIGDEAINQYINPARVEANRINSLNVENCLMKKEETTYCDRVDPRLTSKDIMKQVTEQKGVIKKDLAVKARVESCLEGSSLSDCKSVDISYVDVSTQNNIRNKIQEIYIDDCIRNSKLDSCKLVDMSSTDPETEKSVLSAIEITEKRLAEEELKKKEEEQRRKKVEFNTYTKNLESSNNEIRTKAAEKVNKAIADNFPDATDYFEKLKSRSMQGDEQATYALAGLANRGNKDAVSFLNDLSKKKREAKRKANLKTKRQALREICEAGAEYSRDGYGTPAQIARELAYWVIDLHRQTGGAATEGQLKTAGSHGYMFENCSKY